MDGGGATRPLFMPTMPIETNWLSQFELEEKGIIFGKDVKISRKASLYMNILEVGSHVRIDDFAILTGDIRIGSYVHIPPFATLYGKYGIVMHDFSGVSPRCAVYTESDDYSGASLMGPTVPDWSKKTNKGPVVFEKYAVIADSVIVLPGVTFHEGSVVGAHSLVKKDCDAWTIYAGVPAKPIKPRQKSMIELERKL